MSHTIEHDTIGGRLTVRCLEQVRGAWFAVLETPDGQIAVSCVRTAVRPDLNWLRSVERSVLRIATRAAVREAAAAGVPVAWSYLEGLGDDAPWFISDDEDDRPENVERVRSALAAAMDETDAFRAAASFRDSTFVSGDDALYRLFAETLLPTVDRTVDADDFAKAAQALADDILSRGHRIIGTAQKILDGADTSPPRLR